MTTNPDDYIFPLMKAHGITPGVTKREHFAAIAMQGLVSNPAMIDTFTPDALKFIAECATTQANALIAALNKTKEGK